MSTIDRINKILQMPLFKITMVLYVVIIILFFFYQYFQQQRYSLLKDRVLKEDLYELKEEIIIIEHDMNVLSEVVRHEINRLEQKTPPSSEEINELLEVYRKLDISSIKKISSSERLLKDLESNYQILSTEISSLKSALNPTNPNEILTVARLGDKFELFLFQISDIQNKYTELENKTNQQIQRNFELIDAQVDRIIGMMKWVGLLLIPILINTVRDLIKGKETTS